jgi:3-phenylpropionate/trans-cinnamate dioxygenase ferredoxin subunit
VRLKAINKKEKIMAKHAVCKESELETGKQLACKVEGENVLVFKLEDGYYATQSTCTHLFLPLKKGKIIDGCKVQCPFHRAEFDIKSGEVAKWANFPPGIQLVNTVRKEKALKTYAVSVEDGDVFVEL